ncbi:MAG TPA: ribosomal protein S18-alanine N-acetyltransferase [Negativicutes bacterium]|jgi:ribosomal-protein-alanine N-acetyltransferase
MNEIQIRRMEVTDVDEVFFVESQSFLSPWSRDTFEGEVLENDLAYYLVLVIDEQVIGYAGMWLILDEAHVTNIAILPQYRAKGLGEKLVAALVEHAKAKGAVSMTLEVRVSNVVARHLYDKLGFESCGLRRQYYTDTQEDALIMWRHNL